MRVLLTGANGFIGGHITAALLAAGHEVVAAVRDPTALARRFPAVKAVAADLNRDTKAEIWRPRLEGVDAVINCAGVLQSGRGRDMEAIHHLAPAALFDACLAAGVKRVIQISAISADAEAGTDYALSKKRGDDHLRGLDLDWVVLRPSLIYGEGAYGGTAMLRALAAFPFVTPMIGGGQQVFRPLHVEDLARSVLVCLERDDLARRTLEPVGPRIETVKDILAHYRAWLGRPPARALSIPLSFMRFVGRLGDRLGRGPISSNALAQMEYGNAGRETGFAETIGFQPASLAERLQRRPAQTQDLWHARLYLMRPLVRLTLVLLWLGVAVGILDVFVLALPSDALLPRGIVQALCLLLILGLLGLSLAMALMLVFNWWARKVAAFQVYGLLAVMAISLIVLDGDVVAMLPLLLVLFIVFLLHRVLVEER